MSDSTKNGNEEGEVSEEEESAPASAAAGVCQDGTGTPDLKAASLPNHSWVPVFSRNGKDDYSGFVDTIIDLKTVIDSFRKETDSLFNIVASSASEEKKDKDLHDHRILWPDLQKQPHLPDHPYIVVNRVRYECYYGPDRNKAKKKKRDGDTTTSKRIRTTQKMDCPALITTREMRFFTEYTSDISRRKRTEVGESIKSKLQKDRKGLVMKEMISVQLARPSEHKNHPQGMEEDAAPGLRLDNGGQELEGELTSAQDQPGNDSKDKAEKLLLPTDAKVKAKVEDLLEEGFTRASTVQSLLKGNIKLELVGDLINAAQAKRFASMFDEKDFVSSLNKWKVSAPQDSFHFEPPRGNSNFLLVHQSEFQKELLARYGNEICILDANYKLFKDMLPLFFLVVITNTDYAVVAVFATQVHDATNIQAALTKIKEWNSDWKPRYMMSSDMDPEMTPSWLFSGCRLYIFYLEMVWACVRWLEASQPGPLPNHNDILLILLRIAREITEEDMQEAIGDLKDSLYWLNNKPFREWFGNTWLKHLEKWTLYHRPDWLDFDMNKCDVYRMGDIFWLKILAEHGDWSLTGVLTTVVHKLLPAMYKEYIEANIKSSNYIQKYSRRIPEFLHNRPEAFVKHCMNQISHVYESSRISVERSTFMVQGITEEDDCCLVTLGDDDHPPNCECDDWCEESLPCKHMMAVFMDHPDSWTALPKWYRLHPTLVLDETCLNNMRIETKDDGLGSNIVCAQSSREEPFPTLVKSASDATSEISKGLKDGPPAEKKRKVATIHDESSLCKTTPATGTTEKGTHVWEQSNCTEYRDKTAMGVRMDEFLEGQSLGTVLSVYNHCHIPLSTPESPGQLALFGATNAANSLVNEASKYSDDLLDKAVWYTDTCLMIKGCDGMTMTTPVDGTYGKVTGAILMTAFILDMDPLSLKYTVLGVQQQEFIKKVPAAPRPKELKGALRVGNYSIKPVDLKTLDNNNWLNDQVIHAYLDLIVREANSPPTTKHALWLPCFKKERFWEYTWILLPICVDKKHWVLLAASHSSGESLASTTGTVGILDPLPGQEETHREIISAWRSYTTDRDKKLRHHHIDYAEGKHTHSYQSDGSSCGVFTLMFAEQLLKGVRPVILRQVHIPDYRLHVKNSFLHEGVPTD